MEERDGDGTENRAEVREVPGVRPFCKWYAAWNAVRLVEGHAEAGTLPDGGEYFFICPEAVGDGRFTLEGAGCTHAMPSQFSENILILFVQNEKVIDARWHFCKKCACSWVFSDSQKGADVVRVISQPG